MIYDDKSTNVDASNTGYVHASGLASPGSGFSNATVGPVTTLAAGTSGLTGATYSLYQIGHYGCNCWEGQWIDGDHATTANAAYVMRPPRFECNPFNSSTGYWP